MCGIIAVTDHRYAAKLAYLGLFAQQHRGQESAGIVTCSRGDLHAHRGMGLVADVFTEDRLKKLPGRAAIGHVRYSTAGSSQLHNAQPLMLRTSKGPLAVAHNGNLTNADELRSKLDARGSIFHTTTDTEVILHLIAKCRSPLEDAIIDSLRQVEGAFSLIFFAPEGPHGKVVAVRDPWGFRPLVLGKLGGSFVFASETSALNLLKARFVRELEPGEMVVAEGGRLRSLKPFAAARSSACIFEHVYFARQDSTIFGANVYRVRRELGRALAREMRGVQADMVIPVPDSGIPAALGFSQVSHIPFEMGFIRGHYVGRTFIQPAQALREKGVEMKLHPIKEVLEGKTIVLVDDSIVRGTTCRKIIRMLRRAKVKKIHMAVSSPPIVSPCFYGIDTPEESQLIASRLDQEHIRKYLGVDTLHYLSLGEMVESAHRMAAAPGRPDGFCTACFTKDYPTKIPGAVAAGDRALIRERGDKHEAVQC